MAAKIWLISDTHFGHENIIRYCNRPFKSSTEMDLEMIQRWNDRVKPQDHVWHLGDFCFGQDNLHRVARQLNGHKRLILGNHDDQAPIKDYAQYFEKIRVWRLFKPSIVLTHIPIHQDNFRKALWNGHGHIHDNKSPQGNYVNLCVEVNNYAPVELEAVLARLSTA